MMLWNSFSAGLSGPRIAVSGSRARARGARRLPGVDRQRRSPPLQRPADRREADDELAAPRSRTPSLVAEDRSSSLACSSTFSGDH